MPFVGDELHHYGWNRCSSACHGPDRSHLIMPGFRWENGGERPPMNYDFWYQPRKNALASSEFGEPNAYEPGFDLADVPGGALRAAAALLLVPRARPQRRRRPAPAADREGDRAGGDRGGDRPDPAAHGPLHARRQRRPLDARRSGRQRRLRIRSPRREDLRDQRPLVMSGPAARRGRTRSACTVATARRRSSSDPRAPRLRRGGRSLRCRRRRRCHPADAGDSAGTSHPPSAKAEEALIPPRQEATAMVRSVYRECIHLARAEDGWKIVNTLWQWT